MCIFGVSTEVGIQNWKRCHYSGYVGRNKSAFISCLVPSRQTSQQPGLSSLVFIAFQPLHLFFTEYIDLFTSVPFSQKSLQSYVPAVYTRTNPIKLPIWFEIREETWRTHMDTVPGENIQTQGPKLHGKKSTYQLASVFPVTITSGHCLKINLLHVRDSIPLSYIFLMWKRNGVKTCPYCGGALPPRIRFCTSLGGSLYLFTSWFTYILACILSYCQ